jgi:hypothetical protein
MGLPSVPLWRTETSKSDDNPIADHNPPVGKVTIYFSPAERTRVRVTSSIATWSGTPRIISVRYESGKYGLTLSRVHQFYNVVYESVYLRSGDSTDAFNDYHPNQRWTAVVDLDEDNKDPSQSPGVTIEYRNK